MTRLSVKVSWGVFSLLENMTNTARVKQTHKHYHTGRAAYQTSYIIGTDRNVSVVLSIQTAGQWWPVTRVVWEGVYVQ